MSFFLSLSCLLSVVFLPLLAAMLVGLGGTRWSTHPWSRSLSHGLTIASVGGACVLSIGVLQAILARGGRVEYTLYDWANVMGLRMEVGFLIDPLSALMMCIVTSVSLMVHIYTMGYMKDDPGYARFFSYICLFTFAMLMLVMGNSLLVLFFGWEAVGLVSYLLIGFWFNRPTAIFANMKAFLVNRVGDFGFIAGIGLIVATTGSLNYVDIFSKIDLFQGQILPGTNWSLITVACLCLFVGAMGKSAQFPLHVWLPDSMEGPTPISALIHAATMVTAGIFMVTRLSPLFELSETALNVIMSAGAITAFFMGLLGLIQNDIKRVVAYSTLSQLGYMTVALSASAYSVAIFHLMTHAFFKALLFLSAGSVIMGMHHEQDIRRMGGLRRYMPVTWLCSLLGSLALIGTPLFSGFYSKDSIIEAVHASTLASAPWAYFAVLSGVFVTAFYSFRMYFLVFHGKPRFDTHDAEHLHLPHESPWVITLPLILLAIPSVFIGLFFVESFLDASFWGNAIVIAPSHMGVMHELQEHFQGAFPMALHALGSLPFMLATGGVILAYIFYVRVPQWPNQIHQRFKFIYFIFEKKYGIDIFYEQVLARFIRGLGLVFWKISDVRWIDGYIVNGAWKAVHGLARLMRCLQTGHLSHYAGWMGLGIIVLIAVFVDSPLTIWVRGHLGQA
jgi:NADH-quinone oxidoreductase subunit L